MVNTACLQFDGSGEQSWERNGSRACAWVSGISLDAGPFQPLDAAPG